MARSPRTPTHMRTRRMSNSYITPNSAQAIWRMAQAAGRMYSNRRGSNTSMSTRGSSTATRAATLTQQHDIKSLYRRKRMPKRKKKKWVKFVQKVKQVEASGRGNQSFVANHSFTTTWSNGGGAEGYRPQGVSEVNLYSVNADISGGRDKDIILNETSNYQTQKNSDGLEVIVNQADLLANEMKRIKVPMNHARIDITYTNTSDVVLEVDLYTITHKIKNPSNTTGYPSLYEAQKAYNTDKGNAAQKLYYSDGSSITAGVGTLLGLNSRGATPFNCPGLNIYAGCTVLNKTKVLISPGSSITRQYSDNRHKNIYPHFNTFKTRYDRDTLTYLALAKATGAGADEVSNTLVTSYTKTYSWTQEGQKQVRQTYYVDN